MINRIFIVMIHDLVAYPPMQSLIYALSEKKIKLYFVGVCSDKLTQSKFEALGVTFIPVSGVLSGGQINRIKQQYRYRNALQRIFRDYKVDKDDVLWFEYSYAVHTLAKDLDNYRYVAHFYEFVNDNISWKYKLLYPGFCMKKYLQNAAAVIHCEYNRAIITKGLYELDTVPFVLPNKPYFESSVFDNVPEDIGDQIEEFSLKTENKKIILYQGVFESKERRLEEFCQAINELPENYVFVAMGSGGDYYKQLREKYESERVIFIPFIRPPYHLLITQKAAIGVLTYYPLNSTMAGVINPLYCAPNKIFEYSKYAIPMIANDIPGLKYIFENYHCGETVSYPITTPKIAEAIMKIRQSTNKYMEGSENYYHSVDFKQIVDKILEAIA